jgi:hypothetical protein
MSVFDLCVDPPRSGLTVGDCVERLESDIAEIIAAAIDTPGGSGSIGETAAEIAVSVHDASRFVLGIVEAPVPAEEVEAVRLAIVGAQDRVVRRMAVRRGRRVNAVALAEVWLAVLTSSPEAINLVKHYGDYAAFGLGTSD